MANFAFFIKDWHDELHKIVVGDIVLDLVEKINVKVLELRNQFAVTTNGQRHESELMFINFERKRADLENWVVLPTRNGNCNVVRVGYTVFDIITNHSAEIIEIKQDEKGNPLFILDNNVQNGVRTKNDILSRDGIYYYGFDSFAQKNRKNDIITLTKGSIVIDALTGEEKAITKVCASSNISPLMVLLDDGSVRQPWEVCALDEERFVQKVSFADRIFNWLYILKGYEKVATK